MESLALAGHTVSVMADAHLTTLNMLHIYLRDAASLLSQNGHWDIAFLFCYPFPAIE